MGRGLTGREAFGSGQREKEGGLGWWDLRRWRCPLVGDYSKSSHWSSGGGLYIQRANLVVVAVRIHDGSLASKGGLALCDLLLVVEELGRKMTISDNILAFFFADRDRPCQRPFSQSP